jgi:hypothetical protein
VQLNTAQKQRQPANHLIHDRFGSVARVLGSSGAPIETLHMIGQDHSGDSESGWKWNFKREAFDL